VLEGPGKQDVSLKEALELRCLPEYEAIESSTGLGDFDLQERSLWRPIDSSTEREGFLSSLVSRGFGEDQRGGRLLCVTSSAGIGKSIALRQALFLRSQLDGHIVLYWHFGRFPKSRKAFFDVCQDELAGETSVFKVVGETFAENQKNLPKDLRPGAEAWLCEKMSQGKVTFFIDGLDEIDPKDGLNRAGALRDLVKEFSNLHCIVAGRPYAIVQTYWNTLFSKNSYEGIQDDPRSEWQFACIGMFNRAQIERSIGHDRMKKLDELSREFKLTPRTIEVLRNLTVEKFDRVRTLADVYWEAFWRSSETDIEHKGKGLGGVVDGLTRDQFFDYATSVAAVMRLRGVREADYRSIRDAVLRNLQTLPEWNKLDRTELKNVSNAVRACNSGLMEYHVFEDGGSKSISWRSKTLRDFFAAVWMVRNAGQGDLDALSGTLPKSYSNATNESQNPDYSEFWRFLCDMPADAKNGSEEHWCDLVSLLFQRQEKLLRPTEMMSIVWPRLETLAQDAQSFARDKAAGIIDRFHGEFRALQSIPEAKSIIDRDLVFSSEIPEPGKSLEVRVGHRFETDNLPDSKTLEHRYLVSIYPITRAIYRLFDPGHEHHYGEQLGQYAQDPRCPVVGVTWWDAEMFARWSGSRLLTEWEWEYACRAESVDSNGEPSVYYWENDPSGQMISRYAWMDDNSGSKTYPVGSLNPNALGLYDMLGNVWEWTKSHYEIGRGVRVCRGGSYRYNSRGVSASYRFYGDPSFRDTDLGFRVAMSTRRKP
jgi:hypothetical protein